MKTKSIYLASNISLYNKSRYSRILKHLEMVYPNRNIIAARGLYKDADDFYNSWPKILNNIEILVFVSDGNTLGFGTLQEIDNAITANKTVYYLTKDFKLIPVQNVTITIINQGRDWSRFAKIKIKKD